MLRNIGIMLCAACLFSAALFSCTFIVGSQVKDLEQDGDSDAISDAETERAEDGTEGEDADEPDGDDVVEIPGPDFDTDACGVWGRVYVGKRDRVDIDPEGSNNDMDGNGELQLAVFFPKQWAFWWYIDVAAFPDTWPFFEFRLDEHHYYCIPPGFFSEPEHVISDGWLSAMMYDIHTWEIEDPNNFLMYRSLIVDPVSLVISVETVDPEKEAFRSDSPLYWDGTMGQRIDMELTRRTSRFMGSVQFTGFLSSGYGSRNGRVCVVAYGEREEGAHLADRYPYEVLGSTWYDLEDEDIEGPAAALFNISVNFAAAKDQTYLVYVRYVERRGNEESYPCSLDELVKGSCDARCFQMGDRVGIETERELFTIDPISADGTSDPACTIVPEDLCPTI